MWTQEEAMDSIEQYIYPSLAEACLMGLFDIPRQQFATCSDKRRYSRVAGQIPVDLWVDGLLFQSVTYNVSYGGMFIETFKTFSKGQNVFICLNLNKYLGLFCVDGEITRNSPHGIGVMLSRD